LTLGEILQVVWNGRPVFIRRLSKEEKAEAEAVDRKKLPDPDGEINLLENNTTYVLVCSAVCTHLGCIPIPHMGAYGGWVCICHGSVFDKFARIRQGPAPKNLPMINCSLHKDYVLMEEIKYSREPSVRFWT
jgi:ubiquinol-cytochrome c reductase iron-sulfur subunit